VLKLPDQAEAAFRIEATDAFECRFAINIYWARHGSWFVSTIRGDKLDRDSGARQLPKGEWAILLHLIDQCGFWGLPGDGSHLIDPSVTVEDGEWLTVAGRDSRRYHQVRRFVWRERGLEAVLSFGRRVSGFFVQHPVTRLLGQPGESEPLPRH
jgi:hypothetical protein